jgi:putative transposase
VWLPALAIASRRDIREAKWRDGVPVRTMDHEGEILESYITKASEKDATLTFVKKALKRHGSPNTVTTDGLRSYCAPMKDLGNANKNEVWCWANNRV